MSNIPVWPGTSTFVTGSTPFGFYDDDSSFAGEADQVAKWCAQRLGYPLINIELQAVNFYTAFEEAVTTYGNEVYQYKIRENYFSMEGNLTGSSFNNQVITPNLGSIIRLSQTYASEAGVGGKVTYYTGSFMMTASVQDYDLKSIISGSGITGSVEIKRIFYQEPPAIVRYFDPYAGTGTGVQGLLETFGFGSYSPGVNFMLMPVYWDVMKIQAIEFNDQVRKSAFSFDLVNNQLRIFPVPGDAYGGHMLLFKYMKQSEKNLPVIDNRPNVVADVMAVPYKNPIYTNINQVGRSWVFRFTLALCKEIEGQIRATFQGSNFGGLVVNGSELLTDSRTEKESLMTELKEYLDQTTRRSQLERKQAEADFSRQTMNQIPLLIYAL
jgi:hypothetical protein